MKKLFLLLTGLVLSSTLFGQTDSIVKIHEDLEVVKLSANVWIHRSYTDFPPYGRFYSNGMIYLRKGKCVVFDTPMSEDATADLLRWIDAQGWQIKGIVVNHFHVDCLGGLELFHERGVPSYAMERTIELARADSVSVPRIGVKTTDKIRLRGRKIELYYPGEAHTEDNMVAWIPSEQVLFGGCMLKSVGAGKGNLNDANVEAWSQTIQNVKDRYPNIRWAIPGHGMYGGVELLDFTMELFAPGQPGVFGKGKRG
ncbi:MAG: subclass B1 metallo-beta-lactamase [Bacteroidota bacterium]